MKLDIKSFLIGALSVVCVVLLTGMAGQPPSEIGRYQRVMYSSDGRSHNSLEIIDTATGVIFRQDRNKIEMFDLVDRYELDEQARKIFGNNDEEE